jgi:hypothetical protein
MTREEKIDLATNYAIRFIGLPYRWEGDDPIKGFDCSGLVIEILKGVGILPHIFDDTAAGLYNNPRFTHVVEPFKGCLAFYGDPIIHVAFCVNDKICIEAGGGNRQTTTEEVASARNAFIRMRPITYRKDLHAYANPFSFVE